MVAPSITLPASLFSLSDYNGGPGAIVTNTTGLTTAYNGGPDRLQVNGMTYVSGSVQYFEVEFASTDLSNAIVLITANKGFAPTRFSVGLRSGTTQNNNYRVYDFLRDRDNQGVVNDTAQLTIDPSYTDGGANVTTVGTFVPSDCRALRVEWENSAGGVGSVHLIANPIIIPKSTGLIGKGGESNNPLNLNTYFNYLTVGSQGLYSGNFDDGFSPGNTAVKGFGDFRQFPVPITIGDGIDTDIDVQGAVIRFAANEFTAREFSHYVGPLALRVNVEGSESISTLLIVSGNAAGDDFIEQSPDIHNYPGFSSQGLRDHNFGGSDFSGLVSRPVGVATGGRNLRLSFENATSTVVYRIDPARAMPDFSGSTFDSPSANHYIEFPSTTPNGSVLDFTGVTVASNPATSIFLADVPNSENITIQVSAGSSITGADVTNTGAGTVTISAPTVTFSAPNLTNAEFNNVRCRTSLVPAGPVIQNDNGSVATGGISFAPSNVNLANNWITLSGVAGKLNTSSVIRIYGSDIPAPLDRRAVYYPSTDYDGSNNVTLSASPGGATIALTDQGSNPNPANGFGMIASAWTELDIQLVTSGNYTFDMSAAISTAGVTLSTGDILVLQAVHHDPAGTGGSVVLSRYAEESLSYQGGTSISSLRSLSEDTNAMAMAAERQIDGSQATGVVFDASTPGKIQIDASNTAIDVLALVLYYYYVRWTPEGIRKLRDNIIIENLNKVSIRGVLTIEASVKSTISGAYVERLDGQSFIAEESAQITQFLTDTRSSVVEVPVAIDLPAEYATAIQSILAMVGQLLNQPSGGGGGGGGGDATAANQTTILNRLAGIEGSGFDTATDSLESLRNRGDAAWTTATGFSTHSAADVWAVGTRTVTGGTIDTNNDMRGTDNALLAASYTAPDNVGIAAIPTNPLLTNDSRLNNLNAPIGDIPTNPLTSLPSIPADWITAAGIASDAITEIQNGLSTFDPSSTTVTVGTNQDKTGYSLTQAFPTNFSDLAIDGSGQVTAGNMRGTDSALTALPTIPTDWVTADGIAADAISEIQDGLSTFNHGSDTVTVGTNQDKAGYSLSQAFPANFAAFAIDGSGQVTAGNMRGTDGAVTDVSTIQSNVGLILGHTRPMAKQLGLVSGVSAIHTEAAITVSDGDGSTTITNNGGGSYTVESA